MYIYTRKNCLSTENCFLSGFVALPSRACPEACREGGGLRIPKKGPAGEDGVPDEPGVGSLGSEDASASAPERVLDQEGASPSQAGLKACNQR